jgi:HK97 gp10 family phage protein
LKFKVDIKNLNKVLKELEGKGKQVDKEVEILTRDNAKEIAAQAKVNAPVGIDGHLRNQIEYPKVKDKHYKVVANAYYSGYVEFGTGIKAKKIPTEMREVAQAIKNNKRGGSFKDGLKKIKEWCAKKGIPEEDAFGIFMSILTNGIKPQPFMYPAFVKGRKQYIKDLKDLLEDITK